MSDSVYEIKDIVDRKRNPIPTVEYAEPIGTRKVCCMFDEPDAEKAVRNASLSFVEDHYKSYRHERSLYRCRKCGAYVLKHYEEIATFLPGYDWDNADCFERYYPVEMVEEARDLEGRYSFGKLSYARGHIEVFYTENNYECKSYRYVDQEDIEKRKGV